MGRSGYSYPFVLIVARLPELSKKQTNRSIHSFLRRAMRYCILILTMLIGGSFGCRASNSSPECPLLGTTGKHSARMIASSKTKPRSAYKLTNSGLVNDSRGRNEFKLNVVEKSKPAAAQLKTADVKKDSPEVGSPITPVTYVQELPFEPIEDANPQSTISNLNRPSDNTLNSGISHESVQSDSGMYVDQSAGANSLPIDLPTVLQLAGADNWNVKLAREKVCEAKANYDLAAAAWLPSITFGMGYNHHEGEIQATNGVVSTVSRGSLFFGGGASIANMPLAGGSGGPLRLTADLSIAEAIYRPLAARQLVNAERKAKSKVFNDVMLESALAYFDLAQAQSMLAIALQNQQDAEELFRLTSAFVQAGKGTDADSSRMQVVVNQSRLRVAERQAAIRVASSELARILQLDETKLDPALGIYANETNLAPIHLVDRTLPVGSLVSSALACRPDVGEAEARAQAAKTRVELERMRPLLPYLHVGAGGGVFGGGEGSSLQKLDGRSDIDIQLTWQIDNLGKGTRAAKNATRSLLTQSIYTGRAIKDQIENEVSTAYHQVNLYAETMQLAETNVAEATNVLNKNELAIKGLEGMPLEAVQSIQTLAQTRNEYLDAVMNYNRWQLRLIRAIGQPIANN